MNITSEQLRHAADLKEQIDELQDQLSALLGGIPEPTPHRKRGMSAAGRARIAAAQRARWAKTRAGANGATTHKRRMTTVAKARLAAVARGRWRKVKAAGKNAL